MKILGSRRQSFKAKQRKPILPPQSVMARRNLVEHPVNTQARYIRAGYVPTALIRNGIIGDGTGPGANGLYQIDDRVYTTTKMFLRDAYMYPRQPGQPMDPRFPYELHEFPEAAGAAGLQLVQAPKVHVAGDYLPSAEEGATGGAAAPHSVANNSAASSLSRRQARKVAAEMNMANQVYWLHKYDRTRSHSAGTANGSEPKSQLRDRGYIRNVDDLLQSLGKQTESGRGTPHSMTSNRKKRKGDRTTWEYHTVAVTRVPGYGFGIAVSGGRDNPHFANGDPSIAVSDVLKGGPAEDRLQVNDRIISVNGVSLENVEYATAVQVLRDSGNTVTLVVKRRVPLNAAAHHQHTHSMSSMGLTQTNGPSNGMAAGPVMGPPQMVNSMSQPNSLNSSMIQNLSPTTQPIKLTLTKGSKKDDYGIVLGCRLFIKEISSKTRDQLAANGYSLQEGDLVTRIHNTNCADTMSLKEAKKIIDGCKERLNMVVLRDITNQTAGPLAANSSLNNSNNQANIYGTTHAPPATQCSNNLDDPYLGANVAPAAASGGGASYSSQNLYVQPPTRSTNGPSNGLHDEKSNLTPRGRSRGPIMDGGVSLQQLDRPVSPGLNGGARSRSDEPPRPPPPRGSGAGTEDYYSSRRQLYDEDPLARSRQSSEPRFISFQKEGSVGIRLTGGNEAGIFVTAVHPGSPASLQGLTPGDKILKVNDMDMHGVTREEAVLFLLSLQDRIDLIVQYCRDEYDEVVANQRGDSFHIKTHFHCDNPSKGEMAFKAGDVFRVIDTLHNGVVGSWQVLKIGRGHQEMQRGVIPNKSRAEELATAQFNATKKEQNANESRGNFFRRRRSTHRRSKSLSRENWDDVVFSDSISKFPAYERVVLRHPGFVRPVVLFGPVSDLARDKLAKDFPDKFCTPLQDDDQSNAKCRIVRLSNIRDIMDRGKHALLDITPNAVDRLNYAQFYPVVIFLKTDSKHVIKQLRHGVPKSAHKSSKKLLEQCQKLERIWSHIFSTQIALNDEESWYRKLREAIDLQQSGAVWMSESKIPDSPTDIIFPPHIAQPCSLPCCQPNCNASVSRYRFGRSNSFSLLPNERSLTPPRPPPVHYDHPNAYTSATSNSVHSTPARDKQPLPTRLTSYTLVPIIKPASSMPGGFAAQLRSTPNADGGGDDELRVAAGGAATGATTTMSSSSQPNLLTSFRNSRSGLAATAVGAGNDNLSVSNLSATNILASSTHSTLNSNSGSTSSSNNNYTARNAVDNGMSHGGTSRYAGRAPSTERRTAPYYYHELLQMSTLFDSNLNVRNNSPPPEEGRTSAAPPTAIPTATTTNGRFTNGNRSAATVAAAAAGASIRNGNSAAYMPTPRQRLHSGSSKLLLSSSASTSHISAIGNGGDDVSFGGSLAFGLADGDGDGVADGGSVGTLVDDPMQLHSAPSNGLGPVPAARRLSSSLSNFNHLPHTNQSNCSNNHYPSSNTSSRHIENNCHSNASSHGNNDNRMCNNNNSSYDADSNNNVGNSNECIA